MVVHSLQEDMERGKKNSDSNCLICGGLSLPNGEVGMGGAMQKISHGCALHAVWIFLIGHISCVIYSSMALCRWSPWLDWKVPRAPKVKGLWEGLGA